MHRTLLSLEERHYAFLNAEARRLGVSAAEVVRRLLDDRMAAVGKRDGAIDRLAGIARGDGGDVARRHDEFLYADPNC
jgi:hypothetical protein